MLQVPNGPVQISSYAVLIRWLLLYIMLVPSGCVKDAVDNNKEQSVWAAPAGTHHEECESVPDRCYWTDGWDIKYRKMRPGTCYYNRGKVDFFLFTAFMR